MMWMWRRAMGSDVLSWNMTLHNNHLENSIINSEFKLEARPQDTIKYSSQDPHTAALDKPTTLGNLNQVWSFLIRFPNLLETWLRRGTCPNEVTGKKAKGYCKSKWKRMEMIVTWSGRRSWTLEHSGLPSTKLHCSTCKIFYWNFFNDDRRALVRNVAHALYNL